MRAPRVGFYDDPLFRQHDSGPGHPESPERLDAVRAGLEAAGLACRLVPLSPRPATRPELLRVHTPEHVERVAASEGRTVRFDPDTQAGPCSYRASLLAAGAVVDAVDRVLDGGLDRALCAVRPPGHHAEADRAMGFCLFNNAAVAAAHGLHRGVRRVAVIDWDVHHGNGTQQIFYADPRVLYVSSHQHPFYPGTGPASETGSGAGRGFNVNLPLPAGCGDAEYLGLYREIVLPIVLRFDPELVLVSAGFDAYGGDPLAGMRVTPGGFAELAGICLQAAAASAGGRAVLALEGGYSPTGLAASAAAVAERLLEQPLAPPASVSGGAAPARLPGFDALLAAYRRHLAPDWPVLGG